MSRHLPPDCLLSFTEVAEILGLDEQTLRKGECGTDELVRVKCGRRTLFSFNDVQEWIARRVLQARAERQKAEAAAVQLTEQKAAQIRRKQFVKDSVLRLLK